MGARRPAQNPRAGRAPRPQRRSSRLANKLNNNNTASSLAAMPGIPLADVLNSLPAIAESASVSSTTGAAPSRRRLTLRRSNAHPPPPAPRGNLPGSRPAAPRICRFCRDDSVGRAMHAQTPCDWQDGTYPLECTNCADYRASNPVTAAEHVCEVPRKALVYRKYSEHHPARYDQAIHPVSGLPTAAGVCCVKCIADNRRDACDVDPILGYQCSLCKAADNCHLPDGRMMDPKPNVRQGVVKWFRHACDGCALLGAGRRQTQMTQCSWLADHTTWDQACDRCREHNLVCLTSARIAALPAALIIPPNWMPRSFISLGWAELRPNTAWRKSCTNCQRDNNHCRASIANPLSACGRCTAMGVDCVDCDGTAYPIFDLSQVGFGNFMPFAKCRRCMEMGRNCDRQRPCDSCTAAGEAHLCDNAFLKTDDGKKRMGNCIRGRLNPSPGPLYYLAHGYGANGVDDVKDGSRMEHWIGPFFEAYAMPNVSFHERSLVRAITRQREQHIPRCIPPHAAPGTPLATLPASQLTGNQIANMITQLWPNAALMNASPNLARDQSRAAVTKLTHMYPTPANTDLPPDAADLAEAVNPNPNMAPTRIARVVGALPVVDGPADADSSAGAADEEIEEDQNTGNDQNDNLDSFQSVLIPAQTTQPAASQPAMALSQTNPPAFHQSVLTFPQTTQSASNQPAPMLPQVAQPVAQPFVPAADFSWQGSNTNPAGSPADANIPIDPALQPWDPPTPTPVLPFVPFSPPPPVSLDTTTMPGHAMTLPTYPDIGLNVPNIYTADLLDPNLTSFLDDAQGLDDAAANMNWLQPNATANTSQEPMGVNPFQPLSLKAEQQREQSSSGAPEQRDASHPPVRWRHLNPLHDFTKTLLGERYNFGQKPARLPFTLGISYLKAACPVLDRLQTLPEPSADNANKTAEMQMQMDIDSAGEHHCQEGSLDDGTNAGTGYLACGTAVHPSNRCVSTQHSSEAPALVCDRCSKHSSHVLVDPRHNPLTAAEVLSMRSYLCDRCAASAGSSPESMLLMCEAGVNTVYGRFPGGHQLSADGDVIMTAPDGGDVRFAGQGRPLTGCACGVKVFQTRQCQFHRIDYAEAMLQQVTAVQEWRVQTMLQGRCAGCLEERAGADVTMQENHEDPQQGTGTLSAEELSSWVCFACGGCVMNQAGTAEKPELVAGWQSWFDPPPASLAMTDEDLDMSDA